MNPSAAFGAHFNPSRFLPSFAARTNVFRRPVACTASRTVLSKAFPRQQCVTSANCIRHSYRQVHDKPNGAASSTFRERLGEWRRNGTPEIALGVLILAVVGVDYALQARNDEHRENMQRQLGHDVRRDEATTREEDRERLEEGAADKSLFRCVVRKVPPSFDGHKCLTNVQVGDVVNVLEEGVGPGGTYNMCSMERGPATGARSAPENERRVSFGWFPCSCLEKIE